MKQDHPDAGPTPAGPARTAAAGRAVWLKTLHQWHWISSAVCLLGMLLFAVTGFTLNHATDIESKPKVTSQKAVLPQPLQVQLRQLAAERDGTSAPLPAPVRDWLSRTWSVSAGERKADWSRDEVYLGLPRPGGDAWLRIELDGGAAEYEVTSRGAISWLNDLHKGRNTGAAWSLFIDVFALACLVFCLTGLLILKFHATNRPFTWPMVGLGVLVPALLALLFIH